MTSTAGSDRFAFGAWLFLRVLALTHLGAFVSFWTQLDGLVGPHGILPAADFLRSAQAQLGIAAWFQFPTLAWLVGAQSGFHVLCAAGVLVSLLLLAGVAPALCLAVLWACSLSLVSVGQIFLGFQWDALLLEATLLGIFLAPWSLRPGWRPVEPPRLGRWLLLWLLFRLMFLSGVVKLASGDPTWRQLTALMAHYQTQPLPTPLAWWAHQLPASVHRSACAALFAIELVVPWLLFLPRAFRRTAALLLIALQASIALTGNYAFFNLLTAALCLIALDNAFWRRLLPRRLADAVIPDMEGGPPARFAPHEPTVAFAAFVFAYTALLAVPDFVGSGPPPRWFVEIESMVAPFESLNNYGLFAVMTTTRPELIIEGSDDAREWRAYELPHKPGDLARRPDFVAPHQPRLDWQLWFAALGTPDQNPWVAALCEHLLRGTPEVLALFAHNPFPDHPPRYLRIVRYDYAFTTPGQRARTGHWWRRTPIDFYVPPSSLR